ncbi:hypothetical protein PQR62_19250 [Herbaspirillum lusitanum]|uniref:Uncharacterized protein n=1 Tax=Herbaspirillum lusitanum TaxID=213312 RepID=A0ABW9ADM6_9BURK
MRRLLMMSLMPTAFDAQAGSGQGHAAAAPLLKLARFWARLIAA